MTIKEEYMDRALGLASAGLGYASPNPMVGAVIVAPDGRIIGEGYHRRCGEAHAEVNAVNSVSPEDLPLLKESTIYVTLEPCSHYGKTPPCAKLIIDRQIPRVVVGAVDPFSKVSGRGLAMLREAGCEVVTGVLADRSRELNARFFTAHTHGRPFVTLKWATDRDGLMDRERTAAEPGPAIFSTPVTSALVHRLRATHDAILVGSGTWVADNPRLDVRRWTGRSPRRYVLGTSLPTDSLPDDVTLVSGDLDAILKQMYADGVTSLLVEGGPTVLREFLASGLWDLARVETAPDKSVGTLLQNMMIRPKCRVAACRDREEDVGIQRFVAVATGLDRTLAQFFPVLQQSPYIGPDMSACTPIETLTIDGNIIRYYSNNPLVTPFALATF
ncbi:MAG: bifunctional diaminohydroxyphosphoribosylaminopyrimidine deaminase/5-amino-6-(5-phosphoribosylamino)uracil reductase RibD [Muribaculaceae bacterium]|nr:bifunctional diaminohydroxyphosphoribosylaminopyrimidine deaminase/5-amino-6-(5-phosphoribosylamino)uracil reductase RibD [Muribaculaceae bacterium]